MNVLEIAIREEEENSDMLSVLFIVFFLCMFIGIPIAFSIGLGSLAAFLTGNSSMIAVFPQRLWSGMDSFSLMAVPLFILAGNLMEEGGTSKRLVDFANLLVGRFRGGLGKVAVVSSMIFAGISGSGSADTSAIGSIMIPPLKDNKYEDAFIAPLIASGGTIGPIIPPSLMMVIYCTISGLSVGAMFFAGVIPGILMGLSLIVVVHMYALKHPEVDEKTLGKKFSLGEAWNIFKGASFALLMPVVIIGSIVLGICTATEAASIAIFLALVGGFFVYRELSWEAIPRILNKSAVTTATVMMIVGMASTMSWLLSIKAFPQLMTDFMLGLAHNKYVFLLLVILMLSIAGTFMDSTAALLIFVPVLSPLCTAYGVDPIQFAIVCIMVMHVGTITPPVGVLLYLACGMTGVKLGVTLKYLLPMFIALTIAIILTAFIPPMSLLLPKLAGLIT